MNYKASCCSSLLALWQNELRLKWNYYYGLLTTTLMRLNIQNGNHSSNSRQCSLPALSCTVHHLGCCLFHLQYLVQPVFVVRLTKLTTNFQIKIYLGSLWNTDITLAQDKEAYCTLQVWYAQNSNVKKKRYP